MRLASVTAAALLLAVATAFAGCRGERPPSVVSEAPAALGDDVVSRTAPRAGRLGIRARVTYADVEALAATALPERRHERGERRLCKRVVGVKLCGDAHWDIVLRRTGALTIAAAGAAGTTGSDALALTLPLRVDGTVGLDGRVAAALGLGSLKLRGAARATARIALDLDERWCPRLDVTLEHVWTARPELGWSVGVDIDLASRLDRLIAAEFERLPERLTEAIDCERFRERLGTYWRAYRVPLSLPGDDDARLDIEPVGFGFSGIRAEPDALGVGFVLEATSVVHDEPVPLVEPPPLPPLERVPYTAGRTSFELLVRAGYERLDALAAPALLGRTFRSETAAGAVAVVVESVAFSGNTEGITVALDFTADLPATRRATRGVLYLTARPVVDPVAERISLEDVRLSRVLDNRLWNLVGSVFANRIVGIVERRAVLELGPRARELETLIAARLADPGRTGGLAIEAREVTVRLLSLESERRGLAAVARVDAELDIDVPLAVLERPFETPPEDQ